MAKSSKKDKKFDDSEIEHLYYFHVWKNRLAWIKKAIPVRAKDPITGFFVECYLYTPSAISSLDQIIDLNLAFMPTFSNAVIRVPISNIYPTKRTLTVINGSNLETVAKSNKYDPIDSIPIDRIPRIFDCYKKCSFSKLELECMLNNKLTLHDLKSYSQDVEDICLIESKITNKYSGPIKLVINFEEDVINKVNHRLSELYTDYKKCTRCSLGKTREEKPNIYPLFGRLGKTSSIKASSITSKPVLFVGSMPTEKEEESGIVSDPSQPGGAVLSKILNVSGFDLDNCYFTYAVMCRKVTDEFLLLPAPDNEHIDACNLRLKNEIALVNPSMVVLLGSIAYRAYYGKEIKTPMESGWCNDAKTVFLTFNPEYIARELQYTTNETINNVKEKYLEYFKEIKTQLKN